MIAESIVRTEDAPAPGASAIVTDRNDGSRLIRVPAGRVASSELGWRGTDVAPFFLDRTPVTNRRYERFCRETGHPRPWFYGARFSCADAPVVGVSWKDAEAYARWAGLRLPTEAEWQHAASFDRSDRLEDVAWFRANSGGMPRPVGLLRPNALGLQDLLGNVWEWTSDWYDDERLYRVVRGGSWQSVGDDVRASHRDFNPPVERMNSIGFRCALSESRPARLVGLRGVR